MKPVVAGVKKVACGGRDLFLGIPVFREFLEKT